MIKLDGGIMLPIPKRAKGFSRPPDINQRRWDNDKEGRWTRAYMHCLYTLPALFELPLHTIVPRMAKKMLEGTDPLNIALRFIGEMEIEGYITLEKGFDERVVMPTKKFNKLGLDGESAPASAIAYPKKEGELISTSPVRGGISSVDNSIAAEVTTSMAKEEFRINPFIEKLLIRFPPKFDKPSSAFMYHRAMKSASLMRSSKFRFPYFLDSRSRMYTDTTCGFSPQGADHEKALVIPCYEEALTVVGWNALLESARGYSEMDWSVEEMRGHAIDPVGTEEVWKKADKPYSYMACADLIAQYLSNPEKKLPAFIPLDGRCSGLQHWSAVVKSNAITRHLGMHREEDKLDIYEKIAKDWEATIEPEMKYLATRKGVKIPVMTWGYNATMMTSMDHMSKMFGSKKHWCDDSKKYVESGEGLGRTITSKYGVSLYRQIQETLSPLQEAVDWVSSCATRIAKLGNVEIRWQTPDGFTCLQRKVKGTKVDIDCKLSNNSRFTLDILDFSGDVPNSKKHRSAIAPNIIHSLDATHLRMVARDLDSQKLPMVFIHDSFSTHCNYRDTLYDMIVANFIKLYSSNYLSELKSYWEGLYCIELEDEPEMGDWEPESLRKLGNFFL